jgi:hypothetical protein
LADTFPIHPTRILAAPQVIRKHVGDQGGSIQDAGFGTTVGQKSEMVTVAEVELWGEIE